MVTGKKIPIINKNLKMKNALNIITNKKLGVLIVKNSKGSTTGIITDGDLRRALENNNPSNWSKLIASDLMTSDPITLDKRTLASEALKLMEQNSKKKTISNIPIVKIENGFKRTSDEITEGLSIGEAKK